MERDRLGQLFSLQATESYLVTPSDTNPLPKKFQGGNLYIGEDGTDVKVLLLGHKDDSEAITLIGLAGGVIHPIRVSKVFSTSTSATTIIIFK